MGKGYLGITITKVVHGIGKVEKGRENRGTGDFPFYYTFQFVLQAHLKSKAF